MTWINPLPFPPTPEQERILAFAAKAPGSHLMIRALAGAAKSTTLQLLAYNHEVPTLVLAFNVAIVKDLKTKMPSWAEVKTLHGLGYGAWGKFIGKRKLQVKDGKKYFLLKELVESLAPADAEAMSSVFSDLLAAIRFGSTVGWIPSTWNPAVKRKSLIGDEEFFLEAENQPWGWAPSPLERRLITEVTSRSLDAALIGEVDFSDMILCPALFNASLSKWSRPEIYVDEAQDLSALKHRLLRKLISPGSRLVAVGDPCQAIYGFAGAHASSMDELRTTFRMEELALTTSFRCSRAVVDHVLWRAPDMRPAPWAPEGSVTSLTEWTPSTFPDGSAIICRNNAPLFRLALHMWRSGVRAQLARNDMLKSMIGELFSLGHPSLSGPTLEAIFDRHCRKLRNRHKSSASLEDRILCLKVFLDAGETLGEAIEFATRLESQTGRIHLMTGHTSKGLEFDKVFFLDEYLVGEADQDPNLRYVICTRAKCDLIYISTL